MVQFFTMVNAFHPRSKPIESKQDSFILEGNEIESDLGFHFPHHLFSSIYAEVYYCNNHDSACATH